MRFGWIYKTIKKGRDIWQWMGERPKGIWNSLFSLKLSGCLLSLSSFSLFSLEELSVSLLYLLSLSFEDEKTRSAQEFLVLSITTQKYLIPQFWLGIKHNVVNNSNPIIIIQKAKYIIKRKKKQKKTNKHKQIHNLSLKNILFQITKNPFNFFFFFKKKLN